MNQSFRLIIAFLLFVASGLFAGWIPEMHQFIYLGSFSYFQVGFFPGATIFGIAYIISHIVVVDRNILKDKLLKSTLFVIFGTQISCAVAIFGSIIFYFLGRNMQIFAYLVGNTLAALVLFIVWRMLIPLNNKVSALLQTLLAASVAFLVTSFFGFEYTPSSYGFIPLGSGSTIPKSMEVFFISWQVLVGMTLLYVAKKYRKTETSNATTENQQISQTKMTIDSSISQS